MAKFAKVEAGEVTNIILAERSFPGHIACSDDVQIGWLYDGTTFSANVVVPTVEEVKERNLEIAKSTRDVGKVSAITVDGLGTFDADKESQNNINYAIDEWDAIQSALGNPGTLDWTLEDNTSISITKEQLQSVKTALVLRAMTLHYDYVNFKSGLQ